MYKTNFRAARLCGLAMAFIALLNCVTLQAYSSNVALPPAAANLITHSRMSGQPTLDSVKDAFGRLPLSFELNQGQADPNVKFLSHSSGYRLLLTPNEALLSVMTQQSESAKKPAVQVRLSPTHKTEKQGGSALMLRMRFVNGNASAKAVGAELLPGKSNYFLGCDPRKWRTNIPNYSKVKFENVYPGVDLLYYGNQRQLEYDFVISPGADPGAVAIAFDGVDNVSVDEQGDLLLATPAGSIRQSRPVVYQREGNIKRPIPASYLLKGKNQVGFQIPEYDRSKPLIIDPVLAYSTYLGGDSFDRGNGIVADSAGNAYITGATRSTNFPVTPGAFQGTNAGLSSLDAFVTKLNATGTALIYSTYFGGGGTDTGNDIAIDSAGNAYVTGQTDSGDLPTTPGAFRTTPVGSDDFDAFAMKLNATGSALGYSTHVGGSGDDVAFGIALDALGSAVVTGRTDSANFPVTADAVQTALAGNSDAFVIRLDAAGSGLAFSTYLGGGNADAGLAIALDPGGNIYATGETFSSDFPTTPGAFQTAFGGLSDGFVAKISPTSFDVCIKDDGNGNLFQFNSTTGDYKFTACGSGGATASGIGTLTRRGCLLVLEDQQEGRRVKAQVNECNKNGEVVIQVRSKTMTTFVITDKDTSNSQCACS